MKRGTRNDVRGIRPAEALEDFSLGNALEIPSFPDSDQYTYRWIRVKVGADDDVNNINQRLRQGWRFVKEEEVPSELRAAMILPTIKSGQAMLNGVIQNGDLALAKIPKERAEAIADQAHQAAARQMAAVDARLIAFEDGGANYTLRNNSTSRTRVGREAHLDI